MSQTPHLKVFDNRSELVNADGQAQIFSEGAASPQAQERYQRIFAALEAGFLKEEIELCRTNPALLSENELSEAQRALLEELVSSITSETGRALVGLAVLQLCVKSIEPNQSVRLHKAGRGAGANFSWREGISMRTLDARFITPTLRQSGLLRLNADGFMMTRSLAENYPYSPFYKAAIRGGRAQWLALVENLEIGALPPLPALRFLLSQMLNHATAFDELATQTLTTLAKREAEYQTLESVLWLISRHIESSSYAARLMEIAMHSLMQALSEVGGLDDATLVPLAQMRNANKKHGNVGDIELVEGGQIVESWDAKYGKPYLRDELEELSEKVGAHLSLKVAGFVCNIAPDLRGEITQRVADLSELHGISIQILTLETWVSYQTKNVLSSNVAWRWLVAYTESLAQRRPETAPIDEPCFVWLRDLQATLQETR